MEGKWATVMVVGLALNAVLGFAYRLWRRSKGGPIADVWGQAVLGLVLLGLAAGVNAGWGWARWTAFGYAVLFGLIVMPLWTLAVLIPLGPRAPDYAFTTIYWLTLIAIAIAALLG